MRFGLWFLFWQALRVFAEPAYLSFPSDIEWKTTQTPHFEIIYRKGQKDFAKRTLEAAERAHRLLGPIFPDPPPKTFIVLADFSDSLNGYSLNFPYPHFVVFAAPPDSTSELAHLDGWLGSVVLHEYAHSLHLYPAHGAWKWLRSLFGTWVVPNGMMPQHFHEGLATFLETEFSKGGRGRGSSFRMYTRKAVESGDWGNRFAPLDLMDGAPSLWPLGSSPYYFGYYFYESLWLKKGASGIREFTLLGSRNWPYSPEGPLEDVYSISGSDLWKDIFQTKKDSFENELLQIKKTGVSELSYFSNTFFIKKQLTFSPKKNRLAYLSQSPQKGRLLEIMETKEGSVTSKYSVNFSGSGGLCWKEDKGEDVFLLPVAHLEHSYLLNRLGIFSVKNQKLTYLKNQNAELSHVHQFDCSQNGSLLGTYEETGGQGKVRIYSFLEASLSSREVASLAEWSLPEGTWISSLSVGSTTSFLLRSGMHTFFYDWDLKTAPRLRGRIEGHAFELRRSVAGTFFLIASLSGRDEIWEWHPDKNILTKRVAVTGGILSFVPQEEAFLVSSYRTGGFDLAKSQRVSFAEIVNLEKNETPPHSQISLSDTIPEEDYSPWSTLIPRTWVPSALIVPYGLQLSAWIPIFDLSQKHFYDLTLGVDRRESNEGNQSLPYLSALYGYRFGKASLFQASTYFAPGFLTITQSFFKRWGTSLSLSSPLFSLPIQSRFSILFRKIESSTLGPANQSVGLGGELGWASSRRGNSLDADIHEGVRLTLSHQQYLRELGSKDGFFSSVANFEGFLQSPLWPEAQWALTLRQGYTEGTPLYNSFFEGGGELLFSQGRGFFLNRGYLQGSFAARRIFGGNLEFRFPISKIERGIKLWPIFLNEVSAALVLDTTSFDSGVSSKSPKVWMKEFLWSTGFEIKSQWRFFYYLPTLVRVGAYRGLSRGGEPYYFSLGLESNLLF